MQHLFYLKLFCIFILAVVTFAVAKLPEINDQYENTTTAVSTTEKIPETTISMATTTLSATTSIAQTKPTTQITNTGENIFQKLLRVITTPIIYVLSLSKVKTVMRNIATCVVNGVMELVTYYFPAPLIPIVASFAGMLIPFEPVLMLRDKLPVASYRRAFLTALSTFLGTFDKYKIEDNYEYDPYMTQRFNRRMMNFAPDKKEPDVSNFNKDVD